ncbi:hypothetical protein AB0B88_05120 [Micromonospora haikouensis]|uniref:hypothetical protein n=1 Tax=Micromonospora haikouensis TaxID=686309 RepID=UPI0033F3C147
MPDAASAPPTVTVYSYSQTGQLDEVLGALTAPLVKAGFEVDTVTVRPVTPYPFPWPVRRFFGIFPEAVDPAARVPYTLDPPTAPPGDLVVLGYQVWYLAPSIPVRSLLDSGHLAGRDVLGVVACRNMWYSAALEFRRLVEAAGGRLVGTVAAIDTAPAGVTFVTTLRWLLAGRRGPFWRFPAAGVNERELTRVRDLGEELAAVLTTPAAAPLAHRVGDLLHRRDAAPVEVPIAAGDLLAGAAFGWWGRRIRQRRTAGGRALLTGAFVGTLAGAILLGLPALAAAHAVNRGALSRAVHRRLAPALAAAAGPTMSAGPR